MGYRFVKITTFYEDYLRNYYGRYPHVQSASFRDQFAHLMADSFGWADHYGKNISRLGVEAHEIVANAEVLQKAWAKEHGVNATRPQDILLHQLKAIQPDVVFFQDTTVHNGEWVEWIKEQVPSIRQVIGWCCIPYSDDQLRSFKAFDYMLTCTPGFVSGFARAGIRSYLIYHAFEKTLTPRLEENNDFPEVDFLFIGSLISSKGYHAIRKEIIEQLLESSVSMSIHSFVRDTNKAYLMLKQGMYGAARVSRLLKMEKWFRSVPGIGPALTWQEMPRAEKYSRLLRSKIQAPLYGLAMLQALSRAKIGFNIHIDAAGEYAGNVRLFEVTGTGSCLITDWKKNLKDLFEIDREIVTYASAAECVEKVKWLLNNPEQRRAIAHAGRTKTLTAHTFEQRAKQLDAIIRENLR